jgi:hypothetical protein
MGLDDAKMLDKSGTLWVLNSGRKALNHLKKQFLGKNEGEKGQG